MKRDKTRDTEPEEEGLNLIPEIESPEVIIWLKKSKLLGRLTAFIGILAYTAAFYGLTQKLYMASYVDLVSGTLMFLSYGFNRMKRYLTAKLIFLITLNLHFLLLCYSYPLETGLYLFFISTMTLASVLLGSQDKISNYVFTLLPVFFIVIVFNVPVNFISRIPIEEKDMPSILGLNIAFALSIIGFALYWMVGLTSQTEKWLSDLVQKSNNKNKELEKANIELDKFIYRTTHDLRSPLASVKGLIMIASHETSDPNIQKFIREIGNNIERLDSFTKEIIEYSKNALTEVILEPVNFNTLVDEIVASLKYMKEAQKILFFYQIEVNEDVLIDKRRTSIILYNLIGNAIKYHDATKQKQSIQILITRKDNGLVLSVIDNGTGIAPQYLPKIFDMFYRATSTSSGSGLGLYIVKEAAEKLGGTVSVETKWGAGSTFTVQIPIGTSLRIK